jgi:thioredoxin-related protein
MFRRILSTVFVFLFTSAILFAQASKPASAESILTGAKVESKSSGKNIFLIFHASWCSWCKRLDKAMNSDDLKKIFEDNFVITHLDVQERKGKIDSLENRGGNECMAKLGGEKAGLPFYAFLDKDGKMLSNSLVMNGENIGYPGSEEEIEAFTKLVKKAAKNLSEAQYILIEDYLTKNAPGPGGH